MTSPTIVLILEAIIVLGLTAGAVLAQRKQFRAHGWMQGALVLANLVLIAAAMIPSFRRQSQASPPPILWIHAAFGCVTELLGIYVVLVAGLRWMPRSLAFTNYKRWMRVTLILWWITFALGAGLYFNLNGGSGSPPPSTPPAASSRITISNFSFEPKELAVSAGTEVEWVNSGGRHSIEADDGSFKSETMTAGASFRYRFTKPGVYRYFCSFHGSAGGHDMAGVITVK